MHHKQVKASSDLHYRRLAHTEKVVIAEPAPAEKRKVGLPALSFPNTCIKQGDGYGFGGGVLTMCSKVLDDHLEEEEEDCVGGTGVRLPVVVVNQAQQTGGRIVGVAVWCGRGREIVWETNNDDCGLGGRSPLTA